MEQRCQVANQGINTTWKTTTEDKFGRQIGLNLHSTRYKLVINRRASLMDAVRDAGRVPGGGG